MSYQVLARKYRPASFQELEGQEHVLKALINALENIRSEPFIIPYWSRRLDRARIVSPDST